MAFISLTFNCYIAPIAVFNGMILVSVFSKITIQKQWINKIILQLSPLTLGVYLIHVHPLIWRKYFKFKAYAVNISEFSIIEMLGYFLLLLSAIYFGCSAIDFLRLKLFELLKLKTLANSLDNIFQKFIFFIITHGRNIVTKK